jgi:hypothetical protein
MKPIIASVNKQTITSALLGSALTVAVMTTQIPTETVIMDTSRVYERGQTPVTIETPTVLVNTYTLDQVDSLLSLIDGSSLKVTNETDRQILTKEKVRVTNIREKVVGALDQTGLNNIQ